ncbi:phosphatidate cytidylyltransferase [Desulfomicrobium macestii]|uniref:Phosphatidate cytidylyltransferase n=2 Tax=Desulfomicrobium TaxID=898 RepID=A0A8G2F7D5_DESNO|nr:MULTISPECIES: phosphatidate cytidylyltransferase [Desulfomicrobium]MBE1424372.1 phosphatidate cytidylyltransferase [Desulfomicrobium macestii]SFL51641.1 phosphatidate cytidylyltransferase [Desulfomicrobium norvegicum]
MTSPHFKRVLTSLLLLPLLGWAILSGDPVLSIGVTAVAGLGLMEFYAMFWPGREKLAFKALGLFFALGMIWAPLSWSGGALVCMAMLGVAVSFLIAHDRLKSPDAFKDSQTLLFGLLYLPFILRLFRTISAPEIGLVLLTTFAADTGAYYAGSFIGGPKIWPSVSPKKTWAGSLGGLCASVLVCTAMGLFFGSAHWTSFALLGVALNIAAQIGDFFESALKRWRGVKDSGKILPGHGGILDRIDSLLFTLPLYCGLTALFSFFA